MNSCSGVVCDVGEFVFMCGVCVCVCASTFGSTLRSEDLDFFNWQVYCHRAILIRSFTSLFEELCFCPHLVKLCVGLLIQSWGAQFITCIGMVEILRY